MLHQQQQAATEAIHAAEYVEDYLDFVQHMPDVLQRNVTRLLEIDVKYQDLLDELDSLKSALMKDLDSSSRKRTMYNIQRVLIASQELGDQKLRLVQEIQDIVDNKTRQLETDFKKLVWPAREKDRPHSSSSSFSPVVSLSCKNDFGRENETQNENHKTEIQPERSSKRSRRQRHLDVSLREDSVLERHEKEPTVTTSSKKQKKKKRKTKAEKDQTTSPIDPPIDPDEPTYCLCDQVSFGEMIGCDNDECPREWFHFSCVQLTTKPKGKWYCPTCRGDRSNQMKPKTAS